MKNIYSIRKLQTLTILIALIFIMGTLQAYAEPFSVSAGLEKEGDNKGSLSVHFKIEEGNFLYEDQIKVETPEGIKLTPVDIPKAEMKKDPSTGTDIKVYKHDTTFKYSVETPMDKPLKLTVKYQGCNSETCFIPQTQEFTLSPGKEAGAKTPVPSAAPTGEPSVKPADQDKSDWKTLMKGFRVVERGVGYKPPKEFLAFLDKVESGAPGEKESKPQNLFITLILILLGGLALNLTPCVLPMIPINLMIIGAGATASSKSRGFALGGAYGLGITLAYGILGVIVVLTGSKFGSLNSSPWFNLIIAIVFLILTLAMFNVFVIDLTKYSGNVNVGGEKSKGSYFAALAMGAVSALLAGACVAPVVISVLLLAGTLYAAGNYLGLLLPFLLGLGMAIPWPFAGAGLSFLPKPGMWMEKVKYAFGVIILLFALYYGFTAYKLFTYKPEKIQVASSEGWITSLEEGLETAKRENRPVIIDFWASWCKNCHALDVNTFRNPEVKNRLDKYVRVKYQAEKPDESPAKEVMDYYGAVGLPTYVILEPIKEK